MLAAGGQRASGIEQLGGTPGGDGEDPKDSLQFVKH
jgi:hypothetical protein